MQAHLKRRNPWHLGCYMENGMLFALFSQVNDVLYEGNMTKLVFSGLVLAMAAMTSQAVAQSSAPSGSGISSRTLGTGSMVEPPNTPPTGPSGANSATSGTDSSGANSASSASGSRNQSNAANQDCATGTPRSAVNTEGAANARQGGAVASAGAGRAAGVDCGSAGADSTSDNTGRAVEGVRTSPTSPGVGAIGSGSSGASSGPGHTGPALGIGR